MFLRSNVTAFICIAAMTTGFCIGCGGVKVRKVPTPTQYTHWSDEMQAKADMMEGFRFYLPRPFIQVRQSFPIRTETFLVTGRVSADGRHVIVGSVDANHGLAKYVAHGSRRALIPEQHIQDNRRTAPRTTTQSAPTESNGSKDNAGREAIATRNVESDVVGSCGKSQSEPHSTHNSCKRTPNDNGAAAVQLLRGANFDIVYMPDFEEQFVVSSQAGLGNAEFELNLGQGWSLQGYNSISDNSALNDRIYDLVDRSMELVDKASAANVEAFVRRLNAGDNPTIPRAQSTAAAKNGDTVVRPSQDVTLKVTIVYYAAKGLYPVMKPRELQERVTSQEVSYYSIDLFKQNPRVTGISEIDPSALARAQVAVANEPSDYTIPKYPYQFISFNSFNYMAIEVVENSQSSGHPFKNLYPDGGTTADHIPREDNAHANTVPAAQRPKPATSQASANTQQGSPGTTTELRIPRALK